MGPPWRSNFGPLADGGTTNPSSIELMDIEPSTSTSRITSVRLMAGFSAAQQNGHNERQSVLVSGRRKRSRENEDENGDERETVPSAIADTVCLSGAVGAVGECGEKEEEVVREGEGEKREGDGGSGETGGGGEEGGGQEVTEGGGGEVEVGGDGEMEGVVPVVGGGRVWGGEVRSDDCTMEGGGDGRARDEEVTSDDCTMGGGGSGMVRGEGVTRDGESEDSDVDDIIATFCSSPSHSESDHSNTIIP